MITVDQTLETITAEFMMLLPGLISGIVVFLVTLYLSAWIARAVAAAAERRQTDPELIVLLRRFTRWTVFIFGTLLALEQVNFDVTSLIAGLGIVGFTLGFALQDVAKNFVAGILLLLQQPFNIGDTIEVAGYTGSVLDIDLRTTEILATDGRNVAIPNGDVFVSPITNYSRTPRRRVQLRAGVAYDLDLAHVSEVALQALDAVPGILREPAPEVAFDAFGGSAVEFTAYYWIDTEGVSMRESDVRAAQDAGIKSIKAAFERESIEMPFPTMAILMPQA